MPNAAVVAMVSTVAAARRHGLNWVADTAPGLTRVLRGKALELRDAKGQVVSDEAVIARVRRLAIPPAWQDVWICTDPQGHLQATGRDARGRKQYRYHPDWQAGRGETKFAHLRDVALALPVIRRRVEKALAEPGATPTRERVLAALVRLLDTTWLRIGNPEYARTNRSFGLSTLHNRHAGLQGDTLRLSFVGKGGIRHEARVADRRIARVVRRCRELPGQELFQWVDGEGGVHRIGSTDVNAWLADVAGTPVTAKDFRTWHGSVQALDLTLQACAEGAEPRTAQQVLAEVAKRLGNTPTVCRKAYVHPEVLGLGQALADEAARGELVARRWVVAPPALRGLRVAERRLLGLLRARRLPREGSSTTRSPRR